eukprot:594206-Pyramimonas_sp.AAC.1
MLSPHNSQIFIKSPVNLVSYGGKIALWDAEGEQCSAGQWCRTCRPGRFHPYRIGMCTTITYLYIKHIQARFRKVRSPFKPVKVLDILLSSVPLLSRVCGCQRYPKNQSGINNAVSQHLVANGYHFHKKGWSCVAPFLHRCAFNLLEH